MQLSKALNLIQSKHHCQLCSISFINGDSTRVNYTTVHGDMYENVLLEEDQEDEDDFNPNHDELNELQMLEAANHVDMHKWDDHVQDQLERHLEGNCEDR